MPVVTAGEIPAADAADLVGHVVGRYQLPDVLRRAGTPARPGPSAADVTARGPADLFRVFLVLGHDCWQADTDVMHAASPDILGVLALSQVDDIIDN